MSHPALHEPSSIAHGRRDHFVPDGWDDLERGLCPCGEAVTWDHVSERWEADDLLVVLVLTRAEADTITDRLSRAGASFALDAVERQRAVQDA